jgi:vancomycin permeability regulator SanA
MERYCLEHGVVQEAIVRDDIGFSTYESIYNTVVTLGYSNFIIVTQEYHLYRAMYMAGRMGAEADGFAADYREYFLQIKRDIREYLARCKDFVKVNIGLQK